MTNELREKISQLAYLIQHATDKDHTTYFELDDWFYNYRKHASFEQKIELKREIEKLYPIIHNTLVDLAITHSDTELGKESQSILESIPESFKGDSN